MQQSLGLADTRSDSSVQNLPETFRRLYYHLYTNSNASRPDAIIEDLSLLLLCKFAAEKNGGKEALDTFVSTDRSADEALTPILSAAYPTLTYKTQRFALGNDALRTAVVYLQKVQLSETPAHALGEAFQCLIGPRLRGERGQFFTPHSLVRAMVEILVPQPGESVLDPACGTGGFLSEAAAYLELGADNSSDTSLVGIDKDKGLMRLASAMLRVIADSSAEVYNFNSLDSNLWESQIGGDFHGRFDVILTNPPFGARIGVVDERILGSFDFGHIWSKDKADNWHQSAIVTKSQDPQTLFLEMCVRALKPGGRMGIVLPEGMFGNKKSSYIWDWIERHGHVFALLDCPRTTFQPGTDTKTNVLFFRKYSEEHDATQECPASSRVAVAIHCGHDRRGRSLTATGEPHFDDFPMLAQSFHNQGARDTLWHEVSLKDKRYLVPRYFVPSSPAAAGDYDLLRGAEFASLKELSQQGLITIRKGHEVGSEAYGTGNVPFVRTSDISNFEVSCDPTKSVNEEVYERYSNQQNLAAGDVLVVVDGRYRIGATALLTKNNSRCVVQSHLRVIGTPDRERLDPYELLFALSLSSVKNRIRNLVFIQSTLGTLGSRFLELEIPVLRGEGPWTDRLDRFRAALEKRDELLAELNAIAVQDVEL
jgi:type I restriction enzyme M protein